MTTPAPEPASKAQLELQQLQLSNEKLEAEISKLRQEAQPERWWSLLSKRAIALGATATVVATLYGIWDSYNKTIIDRERTRADQQRARIADQRTMLDGAIKRLETPSTISKLTGLSILASYLSGDDKAAHRQVLFTLAGLMATEKDIQTQAAVIDLINGIPKEGLLDPDDWAYFQELLTTQSRALVAKGDLTRTRTLSSTMPLTDEERAAQTLARLVTINVRRGVVPAYVNYRGIYCRGCDFHGVIFPRGADFTAAILDNANFRNARLPDTVFDNAELIGTSFVEADLRNARFRTGKDESRVNDDYFFRTSYVDHAFQALEFEAILMIKMPNFSCANLSGAKFDDHALFPGILEFRRAYTKLDEGKPGWYQTIPDYLKNRANVEPKVEFSAIEVVPPKFFHANLKDADLRQARFFSIFKGHSPYTRSAGAPLPIFDSTLWQGYLAGNPFQPFPKNRQVIAGDDKKAEEREISPALRELQLSLFGAFDRSEFEGALLPNRVSDFLKKSALTPEQQAQQDSGEDCVPNRN